MEHQCQALHDLLTCDMETISTELEQCGSALRSTIDQCKLVEQSGRNCRYLAIAALFLHDLPRATKCVQLWPECIEDIIHVLFEKTCSVQWCDLSWEYTSTLLFPIVRSELGVHEYIENALQDEAFCNCKREPLLVVEYICS